MQARFKQVPPLWVAGLSALVLQGAVWANPPAGYQYVRVAADTLMIAVGTSMVIDAIESLAGL